jgi:hypothetical protein
MQVDATGPDDALVHCKQQVVKYIARKAIKKHKGVEMDTQEKEYPERKRRKLPPSKTVEFLWATMRKKKHLRLSSTLAHSELLHSPCCPCVCLCVQDIVELLLRALSHERHVTEHLSVENDSQTF